MRFSILSLLIASTGVGKYRLIQTITTPPLPTLFLHFAAQYVTASPIRVVVTEMPNIRFGHALAGANAEGGNNHHHGNNNMIHGMLTTSSIAELGDAGRPKMHGRPCGGGMKAKALSISNAFGRMFGFRLIDVHLSFSAAPANDGGVLTILSGGHYRDLHADGNTVNHHHGSLLRRVRHALGPWESRIVAFVLGTSS